MHPLIESWIWILGAILVGAGLLHLIPKITGQGRGLAGLCCQAPLLDLVVAYFTIGPWIAGPVAFGWWGLLGAVIGQVSGLIVWGRLHEWAQPKGKRGAQIIRANNRIAGRLNNMIAIWATAFAVPVFWFIRAGEIFVYPVLTWTVRLPKYKTIDWVNVSRQRFDGLVGWDLIWCLYCDWMTGVWSLGGEMLRNVESFWCPIRFQSGKKCENCRIDYPDIDGGWVRHDGTMDDVTAVLEDKYGGGDHSWFGHPARLTVKGKDPESPEDQ